MTRKILNIGDVHGRDNWKFMTHGSPYEFDQWTIMVDEGANPDDVSFREDYPYFLYDKIVFVGDYVDSFTIGNLPMKKNLEDIILFKSKLPQKVILLWGNHDVQYFIPNQICSGYRGEMKWDFYEIFKNNYDLFQMAYQEDEYLWTHAGLVKPILKDLRKYDFLKKLKNEAEVLNEAFKREVPEIFSVDGASGGFNMYGGPLWVRPRQLAGEGVDLHQIVGHTPQKELKKLKNKRDFNIWIVDYLEHSEEEIVEPFVLELPI